MNLQVGFQPLMTKYDHLKIIIASTTIVASFAISTSSTLAFAINTRLEWQGSCILMGINMGIVH
jgi:hypothetical protein